MKQPKRGSKAHTFSLRMPDMTRFGLELLANKDRVQVSTIVLRAIEDLFQKEGLTAKESGQLLNLLERVWDESAPQRILNLQATAPEFLSSDDRYFIGQVEAQRKAEGRELTRDELIELYTRDLL